MVESLFVDRPELKAASPPIGVFSSLARGFERIAGQPALILPPLVLDGLLWLGPRLGIQSLFQQAAASLVTPPTVDASVQEGARLLRDALLEAGSRFNLLSLLSTFPVGVPSLMASSMPGASPLGTPMTIQFTDIGVILSVWLALSVVGFGIGAVFHRLIARPIPTSERPRSGWGLWLRIVALAGLFDAGLLVVGIGALAAASVVSLILPLLGVGVLFIGFSLAFWGAIYLVFTPHGMVRHHLGLREAMRESVDLVRWNLVGTTGLLAVLLAVDRLAGLVWLMPDSASWFAGLAVLGHAFVTAMLVAASYAFYSGRRDWWEARRLAAVAPPATGG